jgi:hypothetical protein
MCSGTLGKIIKEKTGQGPINENFGIVPPNKGI